VPVAAQVAVLVGVGVLKGGAAVTVDVGEGDTVGVGTGGVGVGMGVVGVGVAGHAPHGMLAVRSFSVPVLFCGAPGSLQTKSVALLWLGWARCKLWPSALRQVGVPIKEFVGPL
jgi:hypothetical protein